MRKCAACGYLSFGDNEACGHCGAALDGGAPAEALVTAGAPPMLATTPVPPRPQAPSQPARPVPDLGYTVRLGVPQPQTTAPSSSSAPSGNSSGNQWDSPGSGWSGRGTSVRDWPSAPEPPRPASRRSSRRPGGRRLALLIAVIAFVVGLVGARGYFQRDALPAGTGDFVAGRGVAYTSPDRAFDVKFPRTPSEQQTPVSAGSFSGTLHLAQVQTDDYEIVAASMALPVSFRTIDKDAVLRDVIADGAAAQNAKVSGQHNVTHGSATGIEVEARISDGYEARFMAVTANDHIYLLGVHAKTGTSRLYDALVDSLVVH